MDKQTIEQELRWFGTTLNECPNARSLFTRAAGEIARLEALQAPVKCLECRAIVARSDEWYRCFDCKSNLCSRCVEKHFGASYSRHHRTMEEYKTRTETAEAKVATLERQLAEAKASARTPGCIELCPMCDCPPKIGTWCSARCPILHPELIDANVHEIKRAQSPEVKEAE